MRRRYVAMGRSFDPSALSNSTVTDEVGGNEVALVAGIDVFPEGSVGVNARGEVGEPWGRARKTSKTSATTAATTPAPVAQPKGNLTRRGRLSERCSCGAAPPFSRMKSLATSSGAISRPETVPRSSSATPAPEAGSKGIPMRWAGPSSSCSCGALPTRDGLAHHAASTTRSAISCSRLITVSASRINSLASSGESTGPGSSPFTLPKVIRLILSGGD